MHGTPERVYKRINAMTPTVFTLRTSPAVPLEAEVITPDVIAPLSRNQILELPVFYGNQQRRLGDLFDVSADGSEDLRIVGDLTRVKGIGSGMTKGRIAIEGNAGMHVGMRMRGGEIVAEGNISDWTGAEMVGGRIRIRGHAGGQTGAAYRGSPTGMRGGTIIVEGGAGAEVGMRMRGGIIAVRGRVGDFAGLQMRGGTMLLLGGAGLRTGAWMKRGTIVAAAPIELLPTFLYDCAFRPVFLRPYLRMMAACGVVLPAGTLDGTYLHFSGDTAEAGRGEILLWQPATA